jgi:hypothetical protein
MYPQHLEIITASTNLNLGLVQLPALGLTKKPLAGVSLPKWQLIDWIKGSNLVSFDAHR